MVYSVKKSIQVFLRKEKKYILVIPKIHSVAFVPIEMWKISWFMGELDIALFNSATCWPSLFSYGNSFPFQAHLYSSQLVFSQ